MAATARAHQHLFLLLLCLFVCTSVKSTLFLTRRDILDSFQYKALQHDLVNQPSTAYPPNPVTNPVTNPAVTPFENPAPAIVTVPATNPIGVTPNPIPNPGTVPSPTTAQGTIPGLIPVSPATPVTNPVSPATPVTNPVTTPANSGVQPVTNPVTTPTSGLPLTPPVTNPTPNPNPTPASSNAPAIPGQSWCVAKSGLTDTALQTAIDYACGVGGADCSGIQQGGSCYNPNSLQNHASFAFNSYYQKNPAPTSCDFGGTATVTTQNPSTGSCVYPTSLTSGTQSTTPSTTPSNGATIPAAGSSGTPPNVLNSSTNPALGGTFPSGIIGASPPTDSSYISLSSHLKAAVGCIALVASITSTILVC